MTDASACCCVCCTLHLQVRVDFDKPGQPRRVKQSGKWLSTHVLKMSVKR
jgi:hypothetical protein